MIDCQHSHRWESCAKEFRLPSNRQGTRRWRWPVKTWTVRIWTIRITSQTRDLCQNGWTDHHGTFTRPSPSPNRKQQQHTTSSRQLSARRAPDEGEGLVKVPWWSIQLFWHRSRVWLVILMVQVLTGHQNYQSKSNKIFWCNNSASFKVASTHTAYSK